MSSSSEVPNPDQLQQYAAAPNIRLIEEPWNDRQLHSLLKASDCFVCPTAARAPTRPRRHVLRQLSSPHVGANTEFMDDANSCLVDFPCGTQPPPAAMPQAQSAPISTGRT